MASSKIRLARLLVTIALAHLVGCNLGSPKFEAVSARAFILMDETNRVGGLVYMSESGSGIVLKDGSGHSRIGLYADDFGAGIQFKDTSGRVRALVFEGAGASGIAFLNRSGKIRAAIGMFDDKGVTYIALFDNKGDATVLGRVFDEESTPPSEEEIKRDAEQLLEKLKSGWLEGLREIDRQGR